MKYKLIHKKQTADTYIFNDFDETVTMLLSKSIN